jgi:single-strand DNA-binding protein
MYSSNSTYCQLRFFVLAENLIIFFKFTGRRHQTNSIITINSNCMRGVNRVMLIGNLGKDPDMQYLEGNIGVAKFPLATTETFKDRSGKLVSQTEWHTVVLWRGLAELAQKYLHKGSLVYIEGRLRTRSWEDKEGVRKFATEVVGDNLIMLDKRTDSGGTNSHAQQDNEPQAFPSTDTPTGDPGDLPY